MLRIKLLYATMKFPLPAKGIVKKQAKALKAFCVLVKQKLNRQQVCRSLNFRKLLALVYDPDEKEWVLSSKTFSTKIKFVKYQL